MQTAISSIMCALITVSSGAIQQNTFIKNGESVGMEFPDVPVVPGVRSKLRCAALCDQHTWCIAISWNQNNKTCKELTKVLTPETTSSGLYKAKFIEDGYTYIAGMLVKFINITLPWQEAQAYCVNEGGRLVVLDTLKKYHAFKTDPNLQGQVNWWVGATKDGGIWTWSTGEALESSMTVIDDTSGSCLGFWVAKLDDSGCWWPSYFLCEK